MNHLAGLPEELLQLEELHIFEHLVHVLIVFVGDQLERHEDLLDVLIIRVLGVCVFEQILEQKRVLWQSLDGLNHIILQVLLEVHLLKLPQVLSKLLVLLEVLQKLCSLVITTVV